MRSSNGELDPSDHWEKLYREALFEADSSKMPRRIERAKHAILDRLEDVTCARVKPSFQAAELAALRNAHRALRVLEQLYLDDGNGKMIA